MAVARCGDCGHPEIVDRSKIGQRIRCQECGSDVLVQDVGQAPRKPSGGEDAFWYGPGLLGRVLVSAAIYLCLGVSLLGIGAGKPAAHTLALVCVGLLIAQRLKFISIQLGDTSRKPA